MNKRFLFLLAYIDNSPSVCGPTGVFTQEDLFTQYEKGNQNIFAVEVRAPNKGTAIAFGRSRAFEEYWSVQDTVSNAWEIDKDYKVNYNTTDVIRSDEAT